MWITYKLFRLTWRRHLDSNWNLNYRLAQFFLDYSTMCQQHIAIIMGEDQNQCGFILPPENIDISEFYNKNIKPLENNNHG